MPVVATSNKLVSLAQSSGFEYGLTRPMRIHLRQLRSQILRACPRHRGRRVICPGTSLRAEGYHPGLAHWTKDVAGLGCAVRYDVRKCGAVIGTAVWMGDVLLGLIVGETWKHPGVASMGEGAPS